MSSSGIREIATLLGGKFFWLNDHYAIFYHGKIIGNEGIGISLVRREEPVPPTVKDFYKFLRSLDPLNLSESEDLVIFTSEEICFENESENTKREFENFFREFKQYYQSEEGTIRENVRISNEDEGSCREVIEVLTQQGNSE
jgi:hypothetical protein